MTIPTRAMGAVRPQASSGVLAGAAVVAAVFAGTPFLLPDVSTELGVPLGLTGLLSTFQVGSFALAAFLAGRLFRPRRRLHYGGLTLVVLSSVASALTGDFAILLLTRFLAGLGMGTLTWIAWADATRFTRGLGDVAAVAPVTATIASPLLGWLIQQGGYRLVYLSLAVLAALATLLRVDFGDLPRVGRRVSGSRSNRVLLGALAALSLGGSSVFVFSGAIAAGVQGLSPVAMSWALSLNAITGVAATRLEAKRGRAAVWLVGTMLSALAVGIIVSPSIFFVTMALWGFAFWMAVPAIFRLLAERSLTPTERVGDAQAVMAVGRVIGPVVGGSALAAGGFVTLSVSGATFIALAAISVLVVERYRGRSSPV
jgi:predicted MFS family arabinose efflux permease